MDLDEILAGMKSPEDEDKADDLLDEIIEIKDAIDSAATQVMEIKKHDHDKYRITSDDIQSVLWALSEMADALLDAENKVRTVAEGIGGS